MARVVTLMVTAHSTPTTLMSMETKRPMAVTWMLMGMGSPMVGILMWMGTGILNHKDADVDGDGDPNT